MASVTVTLIRPHTHEGRLYPAGASLELPYQHAQFLLQIKAIDKLPAPPKAAPAAAPEEPARDK